MHVSQADDRHICWMLKGRLVLAMVSERAEKCPNRQCGRARRCLARFNMRSNFNTKLGNCPIMSEAEWRAVSIGILSNRRIIRPYFARNPEPPAPEDEQPPGWERLPADERRRIFNEPWREKARKERQERLMADPGIEYWTLLWQEDGGGAHLVHPRDPVAAERRYLRFARGSPAAVRRRDGWTAAARMERGASRPGEGVVLGKLGVGRGPLSPARA